MPATIDAVRKNIGARMRQMLSIEADRIMIFVTGSHRVAL
jgi:hypothetical protein